MAVGELLVKQTFTTTGAGTAYNVSGLSSFSLQMAGTGAAPTSWAVDLETSNDGTNYATLVTHASADGDSNGGTVGNGALLLPVAYVRPNVTALTLGSATNIVVTICGA